MTHLLADMLRGDLATFIGKTLTTCDPAASYAANWHIDLIAEYLQAATRGDIRRLIINMPPRSLKSICVSVAWPAWLLGHDPRRRIIAASYASQLAFKHSLDTRLVVGAPWFKQIFPEMELAADQNEKRKFMTTKRGFRMATSVGGTLTGEGGNFLIIDDPMRPLHAMQAHWREHVHGWFEHTFASRLDNRQKGVIVLVMQRLHEDDLTGYLLKKGGWTHLSLPALATQTQTYQLGEVEKVYQEGELLHPVRMNAEIIAQVKNEIGGHAFAAQYQQQPMPQEGAMLRPWWFGRFEAAPQAPARIVQSWDTAIKSGTQHDTSVCLTFAEYEGKSYLLEASQMRLEYPDLKRRFVEHAARWQPQAILLEDKASGQQLLQDMRRESALPVIARLPKADKITRFAAVSAMIEAGKMLLPRHAQWLADFENEIFAFPHAAHDDQVDALTQYLEWLRTSSFEQARLRKI